MEHCTSAQPLAQAATALPLVNIRTAHAAGKLNVALRDHWVPAGSGPRPARLPRGARKDEGSDDRRRRRRHPDLRPDGGLQGMGDVGPPPGAVYNYPLRPWHDGELYVTGSSGPPDIGVQAWNRGLIPAVASELVAGQTIMEAIDWAMHAPECFVR